ncbi:MAG TPA: Gfo/Idh/MocA family oxidoreductase, partial [Sphingobacteriaceae bacterium]
MQHPIVTGLLAYGMSGKVFHAPFLFQHPGFEFRAVTERSKKNARHDYPDIISYDSVGELMADEKIELVVINTPNNTHYEYARQALQAGKHILVEKPFATSVN